MALLIHVRPEPGGAWAVHPEGRERPVSLHGSESEAERAAMRLLAGDGHVVVRDCYARSHVLAVSRREPAPSR